MNISRLSIAARLGLLLAGLAAIGAILVVWALGEIQASRDDTRRAVEVTTPQLMRMAEMELTLTRISL